MAGNSRSDLEDEARRIITLLGGAWTGQGGLCRCPAHDDRSPSLSVRPGRTRLLLHCFAGCSASDVLKALEAKRLLHPDVRSDVGRERRIPDANRDAALRLWAAGRPIEGTQAQAYLARRGLAHAGSAELRFHPRTPHGRFPLARHRPALLAAVRDEVGLTGVHRTFLDDEAGPRKCGLGRFGSGAVRLGGCSKGESSGPRLGLAEGIETALSATALFGLPCWATIGTERFARVAIPSDIEVLVLFLDRDAGGQRAERLARERFRTLAIDVRIAPPPANDWNDVLRDRGTRPL